MPIRLEGSKRQVRRLLSRQAGEVGSLCAPSGGGVQDGLAGLLAKSLLKVLSVVRAQVVPGHGLAAILVYPLENLKVRKQLVSKLWCVDTSPKSWAVGGSRTLYPAA